MLSVGFANAIKIFQPEVIVIGGGVLHKLQSKFFC
jgi:predicted NBD/HSP70 family sugar kinase